MARTKSSPEIVIPRAPSSWMDLLAETTLTDTSAETVQAEVRGDVPDGGSLRLIVQSYEEGSARPVGSVQRTVTANELRKGVQVKLVELRERGSERRKPRVVAWVETNDMLDDHDGFASKPTPGSHYGEARRDSRVRIKLTKRAA